MAVSAAERDPIAAPAGHRSDRFAVGHLAHARRKDLRRPPDHARVGWRVLALPGTATIVSAVVLGARADLPSSARWAAAACILVALTRVMITFAEVRDLGDVYRQSRTDELTGLPNRRALVERCEELAGPTGLLLLDLDRFKEVNDSLGHGTGDALLVRVGTALRGAVHAHDLLARLGGDEFAVLVPDASPEVLAQVAADLDRALDRPFALDHVVVRVTPSIGSAIVPDGAAGRGELLRRADVAMYQAKSTQAGTVAYADVDTTRSVDGLQAVAELRRVLTGDGLPAGSLVVEFQPQILLATGAVSAVEALVRWDHPSRGRLLPEGFLDAAETAGLLSPLTDIVMDGALRACRRWWALGDRVPVTVNLSAGNASDRSLPSKIADSLARHQLPGRALVVELTEGMLLVNPVRARSILGDIRALGVAVSIDDYGTGQSSLSYLRTLPVDELKIDRVFTHDLAADPAAATIVRHTIDLARALGLRSVAEGVEDHVTLQVLSGFGCDAAQGFHVAAPMPAADLMDWLDNHGSMAVSTPRALH
jgi:diguanylate cyclase (GGDEF)-like protein